MNIGAVPCFKDELPVRIEFFPHDREIPNGIRKVTRDITMKNDIEFLIAKGLRREGSDFTRDAEFFLNVAGLVHIEFDPENLMAILPGNLEETSTAAANFKDGEGLPGD